MALVVLTNTYNTLSEADIYAETRPFTEDWEAADDEIKEGALIMSFWHLELAWTYEGSIADTITPQTANWPRDNVYNRHCLLIGSTTVPQQVKDAQMELAFQWVKADQLMPDGEYLTKDDTKFTKGLLKREKLEGLEREYQDGNHSYLYGIVTGYAPAQKVYPLVELLLREFITSGPVDNFKRVSM